MRIINGQLWSPFYIMVKDYKELGFRQLLQLLNIDRYTHQIQENKLKVGSNSLNVLYVIRRGNWIQIMDNWGYTLWQDKRIKKDIEQLSKSYEIFQFSVGDIDYDYDFAYFKNRELRRRFSVVADNPENEIIKEDFGLPLKGESKKGKHKEPFDKIIPIAKSLGIKFEHNLRDIEIYSMDKEDLKRSKNEQKINATKTFIRKLLGLD